MGFDEEVARLRRRHAVADESPTLAVPSYAGHIGPLTAARRKAFARHLRAIVHEALTEPPEAGSRRPARPALPPALAEAAATACGVCRGNCCSRGGEHAYLDADTIRKVAAARPGLGRAGLAALYLSRLGESYAGSCVFHAAQGCVLPRDLRSDLCNDFYCNDLTRFIRAHPDGPPPRTLVVGRDDEDRVRGARVLAASQPVTNSAAR